MSPRFKAPNVEDRTGRMSLRGAPTTLTMGCGLRLTSWRISRMKPMCTDLYQMECATYAPSSTCTPSSRRTLAGLERLSLRSCQQMTTLGRASTCWIQVTARGSSRRARRRNFRPMLQLWSSKTWPCGELLQDHDQRCQEDSS